MIETGLAGALASLFAAAATAAFVASFPRVPVPLRLLVAALSVWLAYAAGTAVRGFYGYPSVLDHQLDDAWVVAQFVGDEVKDGPKGARHVYLWIVEDGEPSEDGSAPQATQRSPLFNFLAGHFDLFTDDAKVPRSYVTIMEKKAVKQMEDAERSARGKPFRVTSRAGSGARGGQQGSGQQGSGQGGAGHAGQLGGLGGEATVGEMVYGGTLPRKK